MFVLGYKVAYSSRFRLREGLLTWPVISAELRPVLHVLRLPIYSIIPVQVRARVLGSALAHVLWIGILPLIDNLMVLLPMKFNECRSVHIDYWDEVKLGRSQHPLVLFITLQETLMQQFQANVQWHLCREQFSRVSSSGYHKSIHSIICRRCGVRRCFLITPDNLDILLCVVGRVIISLSCS